MTLQFQVSAHPCADTGTPESSRPAPTPLPRQPAGAAPPAQLKPLPQPRYAVINEPHFTDELHKMDLESELALAEQGLAEYLEQCPPYPADDIPANPIVHYPGN